MRYSWLVLMIIFTSACASMGVQKLSLTDPRLPLEARRWLADAEDEVAIARSQVVDARDTVRRLEENRESIIVRLEDTWFAGKGGAKAEGAAASRAFVDYADERITLARLELEAAQKRLELAGTRLTQARAETAIRYDLAVYEIESIMREVEQLKNEVAARERSVEEQRANTDRAADAVWKAYRKYVSRGGVTNALWVTP